MVEHQARAANAALNRRWAGEGVDKTRLTRVGAVLKRLGIEHIPSYSPQGRGRCERVHRTFQDRLVKELTLADAEVRDLLAQRLVLIHVSRTPSLGGPGQHRESDGSAGERLLTNFGAVLCPRQA